MNRKKLFSLKMDQETLDMLKQIAEDTMGGNMSLTLRRLVQRDYSSRYRLTDAGRAAIEQAEKK